MVALEGFLTMTAKKQKDYSTSDPAKDQKQLSNIKDMKIGSDQLNSNRLYFKYSLQITCTTRHLF